MAGPLLCACRTGSEGEWVAWCLEPGGRHRAKSTRSYRTGIWSVNRTSTEKESSLGSHAPAQVPATDQAEPPEDTDQMRKKPDVLSHEEYVERLSCPHKGGKETSEFWCGRWRLGQGEGVVHGESPHLQHRRGDCSPGA